MQTKYCKLIGVILICGGFLLLTPYLQMIIRAALANPDILQNIFISLHVLFFTNWLVINTPGFILIVIGIYLLIKNSRNKSIKISE